MSPKRRHQWLEVGSGDRPPSPSTKLADAGGNLNLSPLSGGGLIRPITPAEIAVNPCITSRRIQTRPGAAVVKSEPVLQDRPHSTKGNKTYRVQGNQQQQYSNSHRSFETPAASQQSFGLGHVGSLSQGIFGLPVIHDYLRKSQDRAEEEYDEELGATILDDSVDKVAETEGYRSVTRPVSPQQQQQLPSHLAREPCPRMKSTLPSFRSASAGVVAPPFSTPSTLTAPDEDMHGILQVRPASRRRTFRTTSEQEASLVGSGSLSSGGAGGRRPPAARSRSQRVQTSLGFEGRTTGRRSALPTTDRSELATALAEEDVDSLLQDSIIQLKLADSEWEKICCGFQHVQRLTESKPKDVKPMLRKIIWSGVVHLSSSRTKVSRAACQCFKRLYETQGRSMEAQGDRLFTRLLDLCGGPCNKFIQEECKEALLAAVKNTDPLKCVALLQLRASNHRNRNVRQFAAFLLVTVLNELPPDRILSEEFAPTVIPLIVHFLREGLLSTRLHAKECLDRIIDHPDFDSKLQRHVSPEGIRNVSDTLRKLRASRGREPSY